VTVAAAPRNPRAVARGQALRAEIRAMLEQHPPLLPPLAAKDILRRLSRRPLPSVRTVRWHVSQIRLAAELESLADVLPPGQFTP
jgi:hypothetical protein